MINSNKLRTQKYNSYKALFEKNESSDTFLKCRKYARNDHTNILLTGETGTGKELHARYIHQVSSRAENPFIPVNFSSLNETTVYSSLFGHKKGSFTDASENQIGLFKAADGGTIFLDEIGDASHKVQNALLRVLDYGEILPLGETKPQYVDVRIISASNADFNMKIADKSFREDLYYRLSGLVMHLSPLRSKPHSELKNILNNILDETAQYRERNRIELTENAWNKLLAYNFGGNYREAYSISERLYILERDIINEDDLVDIIKSSTQLGTTINPLSHTSMNTSLEIDKPSPLNERIARIVFETVAKHNGIKKYACEELGISFKTLNKYLKQYSSMVKNPIPNSNSDCNYSNDERRFR